VAVFLSGIDPRVEIARGARLSGTEMDRARCFLPRADAITHFA